jgi:hypothetical protein
MAKSASATWAYFAHDETYQVTGSSSITVSISGTTPITLPNHTTTLTWTTTGIPDSCDATANGLWNGPKSPNGGSEQVADLYTAGTYTYEIICHKAGSPDASAQTQVDVFPSNGVTASLSSNTYTLPYGGGSATLTWSSTGATACNSGDFTTGGATTGNDTVNLTTTTTYTVICDDGNGNSAQAQVTITVLPQSTGMTVSLQANPASMNLPTNQTTLRWTTTGTPDSCVGSNGSSGWSGSKNPAGGQQIMSGLSLGTYIYTITCMKTGYPNDVSQVSVTVFPKGCVGTQDNGADCFTASLIANPSILQYGGGTSTLTWNSLPGGISCSSPDFSTGNAPNGSVDVNLTTTTTYHLTCQDGNGNTATPETTVVVLDNQVVNGVCSPQHFNCVAGTSIRNRTGINSWTWQCQGINGGTTASCSENFPVFECSDGIDNDTDTLIDTADPGCHTDGDANNAASYDPNDNTENNTVGVPQCSDGIDNDGDKKIDFKDEPTAFPAGIGDSGCSSAIDNSESNNPKPKQIEI